MQSIRRGTEREWECRNDFFLLSCIFGIDACGQCSSPNKGQYFEYWLLKTPEITTLQFSLLQLVILSEITLILVNLYLLSNNYT